MTPQWPARFVIGVIGAESTGKTELADALARRISERGTTVTRVGEYLREWCDREHRTPRPDEQAAIAGEQARRIEDAAKIGVVVADTTSLMTAVYSDLLFGDTTLYAPALSAQHRCAITLLTALDLPWVADGLQRDGPHVREPVDLRLRAALNELRIPYTVVHGQGDERLRNAWNAINSVVAGADGTGVPARFVNKPSVWSWSCEKCSDPACEHRLFRELIT